MIEKIELEIRKFYNNILLQSNFKYREYLRSTPKKLCKDINRLDEAYTFYPLQEGAMKITEIEDFIHKIKQFVC